MPDTPTTILEVAQFRTLMAGTNVGSTETQPLHAGWDFDTQDDDVCQSGFGFQDPWQQCGGNFGVCTSLKYKLQPVDTVYWGPMFFEVEEAGTELIGRRADERCHCQSIDAAARKRSTL